MEGRHGDPERIARNEGLFRMLNDGRELEAQGLGIDGLVEFTCECGLLTCHDPIRLSVAEYEEVRREPRRFAIVDGHDFPEAEDVIDRRERYAVVEKRQPGAAVAEASDPRQHRGANAPER